jgi:hypothetical protein
MPKVKKAGEEVGKQDFGFTDQASSQPVISGLVGRGSADGGTSSAGGNPYNTGVSTAGRGAGSGGLSAIPGGNLISSIPGGGIVGQALGGMGIGSAPNTWNSDKASAPVFQKGEDVYTAAMNAANGLTGPQISPITAQTVATPQQITAERVNAPQQINAGQISTPGMVGGQEASDLRAQQLSQAAAAANSPSSAAATMKAGLGQVQNQALGAAVQARGGDRASAKRDALLGISNRGMQSVQEGAALSAQENLAKQNAYSAALAGVRSGDVSGTSALTQIGAANLNADMSAQQQNASNLLQQQQLNQGAGLQAQQLTQQGGLQAATANQGANLTAQQATQQGTLNAWQAQQQAQNNLYGTALQSGGLQNQVNSTAAQYATGMNAAQAAQNKNASNTVGSLLGSVGLSDENAKENIGVVGSDDPFDTYEGSTFGDRFSYNMGKQTAESAKKPMERPQSFSSYNISSPRVTDFLSAPPQWQKPQEFQSSDGSNLNKVLGAAGAALGLSDEDSKQYVQHMLDISESPAARRKAAEEQASQSGSRADRLMAKQANDDANRWLDTKVKWTDRETTLSDARTKEQVDHMSDSDLIHWAEKVPAVTFKYKTGIKGTDEGEQYHLGTIAQELERTGPPGKLMVSERSDGMKQVDYGALAFLTAKAALAKAGKGGK